MVYKLPLQAALAILTLL